MQKINEILKKYNIKPHRYEKNGKVIIVSDEVNKYVIKKIKGIKKSLNI